MRRAGAYVPIAICHAIRTNYIWLGIHEHEVLTEGIIHGAARMTCVLIKKQNTVPIFLDYAGSIV